MASPTEFAPAEYILGETRTELKLSTSEEHQAVGLRLVQQARRTLCITSRLLDPAVYNNEDFCTAVSRLATHGRLARIRILVRTAAPIVRRGHCLLKVARRLSSYVEIRRFGPVYRDYNGAFMIVDGAGCIERQSADRYEAIATFHDPHRVRELFKTFQKLWDASELDPELRRLHV